MGERVPDNTVSIQDVTALDNGFSISTTREIDGATTLVVSHRLDQMIDLAFKLLGDTRLMSKLSVRIETIGTGERCIRISRMSSLVVVQHRYALTRMLEALDQDSAAALYGLYQRN